MRTPGGRTRAAFPALTDPATLASWTHAYWASSLNLADGAEVTTWTDEGSAADDLAKVSATGPTYRASAAHFRNQPVVQFDGAQYLRTQTAGATSTDPRAYVMVGNVDWRAGANRTPFDGGRGVNTGRLYVQSFATLGIERGTGGGVTGYSHDADPHLFVVQFDGASSAVYVDGTLANTVSAGTAATYGLTLGSAQNGTTLVCGSVAFAAVYSGVLDETTRNSVWEWARNTYGLRAE